MDARASRSNLPFDATFTGWDNIQKFWAIEWTCACHNERYVTIDDKGSMIPGYLLYAVYIREYTTQLYSPDAPCMEHLPTFTIKINQMWVYIPYMQHMGRDYNKPL